MDRVKRRLAERMSPRGEPVGFCGVAQEKKPPQPYFAVEGDEEKLPPELEPPRRGGGSGGDSRGERLSVEGGPAGEGLGEGRGGGERRRRLADEMLVAPFHRSEGVAGPGAGPGTGVEAEPPALRHESESGTIAASGGSKASRQEEGLGVGGNPGDRRRRHRRRRDDREVVNVSPNSRGA